MAKFLEVDKIEINSDSNIAKYFINVEKITTFSKIADGTYIYVNDPENKEKFDLHENGYKTMISLNDHLDVFDFCCKLSFEELVEKCDFEIEEIGEKNG